MYIGYGILFLVIGGLEATIMRIQLAVPHNHFVSPQTFNRLFTMHGTTMVFLVGMPIAVRVRQLSGAADDRRARHGVPAAERLQLLDERSRRHHPLLQLHRRQRSVRRGQRSRRGLVRLCAADLAGVLGRAQHRLLDHRLAGQRLRQHRHRAQHRDHHPVHALPGHDAGPHAAVRLAEPGHVPAWC